jgi:hypothetical protein
LIKIPTKMFAKDHLQPMTIYDEESPFIKWWTELWDIWATEYHPLPESKELQIFLDHLDDNWSERLFEKGVSPEVSAKMINRAKNIFYRV